MNVCSNASHQKTTVWCFERVVDILITSWFVFITECEFDNTHIDWTTPTEWCHVSGISTHWSVKWCVNLLNHKIRCCSLRKTGGVIGVVYIYTDLIVNRNIRMMQFQNAMWSRRNRWLCGMRCRSAAVSFLGSWVRTPLSALNFVVCDCCVVNR